MSIGIVTTSFGKICGIEEEGVLQFKGVPYAAPPVGELRWKPPVDPAPWEGIMECKENKKIAAQKRISGLAFEPYSSDFYYMGNPPSGEDCLYLNIATTAQSANDKYPVFMWFHGGGLADGYAYEVEFNPAVLAKKGIVVVSVAQRLNLFGYMALPQLSAEQGGKSGNYGFMDEVKALDWVYENIAAFGGDPENITVGGQSGGTMKSGALAASPYHKGRVKRVINQSSLCWRRSVGTLEQAEQACMEYLESMGINPHASLDELRAIPAPDLLREPNAPGPRLPSAMVYDGDYVPYSDMMLSVDEYAGDCDYLCGGNYGESSLTRGMSIGVQKPATKDEVCRAAKTVFGDLYEKYDFEQSSGITEENADHRSRWIGSMISVAEYTKFGVLRAKTHPNSRTFSYIFSHVTPDRPEEKNTPRDADKLLAWHSSELWYTFSSLRDDVPPARAWQPLDYQLADQISSYWANFIKYGDPNGEGLPVWPESRENRGWMELGDTPTGHDGIDGALGDMIFEFFDRRLEGK